MKTISQYLFDESRSRELEFRYLRNKKNIEHGTALGIFVLFFEFIFIVIAVNSYIQNIRPDFKYGFYISMYGLMILVNLFALFQIHRIDWTKKTEAYINRVSRGIVLYNLFTVLWGTGITLVDQQLYSNLNAFIVNLMVVATVFYHDRRTMLSIFALSVVPMFLLLPFFQGDSSVLIGHYVNGSVIIGFTWIASRLIFSGFLKNYIANGELSSAFKKLERIASIDALTGLSNRYGLTNYIAELCALPTYTKKQLGIIMIDIDNFKNYNDVHGHVAGDAVLSRVGKLLGEHATRHSTSPFGECLAVRYGGEEFLVLAENKDLPEASKIAEEMRLAISSLPAGAEDWPLREPITISAGVVSHAIYDPDLIWKAIEKADQLLYVSKSTGKNKVSA